MKNENGNTEQEVQEQRTFVKHPKDIPVHVTKSSEVCDLHTQDSSCRGLCYYTKEKLEKNEIVDIDINIDKFDFKGSAKVAFCKKEKENYLIGLEFLEKTSPFEVKMMQQICQIFKYWKKCNKGKVFDLEQAAKDWIASNACDFHNEKNQTKKRKIIM